MTLVELEPQHIESLAEVTAATDAAALEQIRVKYLGRNGLLPAIIKQMKDVPAEERPEFGKRVQAWRAALEAALNEKQLSVAPEEAKGPAFDHTLPGRWFAPGSKHPVSRVIEETAAIFSRLGFTVADGPDIENRFNNFTALNTLSLIHI